jgi:hypothetical protein
MANAFTAGRARAAGSEKVSSVGSKKTSMEPPTG